MEATRTRRIEPTRSAGPHDLGLVRELDVIGDRQRGIAGLFPVSRSDWRAGVRAGRYPPAIKVPGRNLTFWKRSDVLALVAKIAEAAQ